MFWGLSYFPRASTESLEQGESGGGRPPSICWHGMRSAVQSSWKILRRARRNDKELIVFETYVSIRAGTRVGAHLWKHVSISYGRYTNMSSHKRIWHFVFAFVVCPSIISLWRFEAHWQEAGGWPFAHGAWLGSGAQKWDKGPSSRHQIKCWSLIGQSVIAGAWLLRRVKYL